MTPDTAALRAQIRANEDAAAFYGGTPNRIILDPDTVRALCDAADEVERLRAEVGQHRQRANEAARLSSEAVGRIEDADRRWEQHQDVCVMASLDRENLETERDASRTAHAGLVADLRALHVRTNGYSNGADFDCCATCFDSDEQPEPWPCPTVALLDRHAPEATP